VGKIGAQIVVTFWGGGVTLGVRFQGIGGRKKARWKRALLYLCGED
jgi:hypothetical protein